MDPFASMAGNTNVSRLVSLRYTAVKCSDTFMICWIPTVHISVFSRLICWNITNCIPWCVLTFHAYFFNISRSTISKNFAVYISTLPTYISSTHRSLLKSYVSWHPPGRCAPTVIENVIRSKICKTTNLLVKR